MVAGFLFMLFVSVGVGQAKVPLEYRANANFQPHIEKISELFLQLDANSQIGENLPTTVFSEISDTFGKLTPHLPQDYKFKLVYTKCSNLAHTMSAGYDYDDLASFMENCHKPFSSILRTIKAKYTVKADARVLTPSGAAPLVVTFDARGSHDPSNETIPAEYYYWYYRDVEGKDRIIGKGSVVKHTFTEP